MHPAGADKTKCSASVDLLTLLPPSIETGCKPRFLRRSGPATLQHDTETQRKLINPVKSFNLRTALHQCKS